jgi:outer membrane protein assembly factor BamB
MKCLGPLLAVFVCGTWLTGSANAQWLQLGGPNRDFKVESSKLADKWPEAGPPIVWRRDLGDGYSSILVDGERLFVTYRKDADEHVVCLNRDSGRTVWDYAYPAAVTESSILQFGPGPRSTPLIAGSHIYTIGVRMVMHCLEKETGKVVWQRDLQKEFGPDVPGRGYSPSPILYRDTIIVPVGGRKNLADDPAGEHLHNAPGLDGQAWVGLDLKSGATRWKNQSFAVALSSPVIITFAGQEQLLALMGAEAVGLNPANGDLFWRYEHVTQYGFNCSSPVFDGRDTIFMSSAYGSGSRAIRLTRHEGKTVATELWKSRKIGIHFTNAVVLGEYVYGSSGMGPAFFFCANLGSGELMWRKRGFAKANVISADGKVILLDEEGVLALITLSPEGMTVHSQFQALERYAFAAPTLVGRTLYIRDRKSIIAFDLGPPR